MSAEIYLDVCGLEPPEPMVRALDALAALAPGQRVRMLIDREPRPFFRILDANHYRYTTTTRPDYLYEILIWHQPDATHPTV
jgi:TusA-related sulfurtransferase